MSDSNVLEKYGIAPRATPAAAPLSPDDEIEDCGAFGWLRGVRERAVMLELRKRDGNILAIGYNWIERVHFDPSVGITIFACGLKVTISGARLGGEFGSSASLLGELTRHRVCWIRELTAAELLGVRDGMQAIEGIHW